MSWEIKMGIISCSMSEDYCFEQIDDYNSSRTMFIFLKQYLMSIALCQVYFFKKPTLMRETFGFLSCLFCHSFRICFTYLSLLSLPVILTMLTVISRNSSWSDVSQVTNSGLDHSQWSSERREGCCLSSNHCQLRW